MYKVQENIFGIFKDDQDNCGMLHVVDNVDPDTIMVPQVPYGLKYPEFKHNKEEPMFKNV